MLRDRRPGSSDNDGGSNSGGNDAGGSGGGDEYEVRDIRALTPPPQPAAARPRRGESWDNGRYRTTSLSLGSDAPSEQFTAASREFSSTAVAGSTMRNGEEDSRPIGGNHSSNNNNNLGRIGEDSEETNPLAIVPDVGGRALDPPDSSPRRPPMAAEDVPLVRVRREEVESKILAWQTAEIARANNRFKREDVIIGGWESEQTEKAAVLLKKTERKLEEKRARATEKMQNEVAKAHRKAEERRASAEAKRGTKEAKILEMATLMRAVGRAPAKRSFFF